VTSEAAAEARRRALRFVGFLEAYYALRYPPVHDLAAYRDVQVAPADVPAVPGVALTGGGEPWLAVELVDLPVPPELPAEVQAWVTGPVTAEEAPRLGPHPDARRRLLPQAAAGPERGVLDGDTLAAGEAEGFPPGQALAELAAAEEDRLQAEEHLAAWTAGDWHPWAERWQAVEAGRALYRTLFDLRVRIEREGELFELVWGFGRLRWQLGGERIDQPLLCTPVEVTMDTRSGRLEVTPAGPTVLDVSWSVDLPVRDRVTLNRLREQLEDEEVDPWTPEAAELLRPVLRAFDHDGVLVPAGGTRPPAGEHAALDPGEWVLYVRRRQPNFRGFLDEQRRLYEAGAAVPDPFATLAVDEASAFADPDPYAATAGDTPGGRGPAGEEEPLLPLAVNEEQLQIVAMARARAGVTAQGPPGTGKSHTIANLISHYVAHGKRVLVTAAKEQALGVLIDKVPEGIRQLCVPVLGSDASARARLQATVTTIADAAHRRPDRSEIARLEADLAGLREGYAATANTLKAKRAAETTIPPVPPRDADTAWTPSSAADWVRRHPELGWVPDRVGPDTPPPVSAEELAELVRHCANLDPAGAEAALAALPPAGELPAGATLGGLRLERSRLLTALADLEHLVVDWVRVDATAPDELARLGEAIRSYAYWHTKIAGTWVARVVDDTADPALVAGWGEFLQAAQADREGALAASRALAADTVTIDGEVDQALRDGLAEARQRFAAGKGVGRFQAGARRALERCRVDGSPPSNVAGLDLVQAELARREWRRRLTTRWHNAVSRVGGPVLGADRPPEDAVGEHLGALRAALAWRPEIWPAVAAQITAAGLRVPAPATADDLAALADTCTGLHRRARLREIDVRLTALAATLEDGSRRPGASSLWVGLAAALAAGADDTWDQLLEQAARLAALRPAAERRRELLDRLAAVAPRLATDVTGRAGWVEPVRLAEAWRWRQTDTWLAALADGRQPAELQADLEQLTRDQRRVTEQLVAARAWAALAESIDDRRRSALNRFTAANAKLGKGTGRYAPRWEHELRAAMDDAKDAVPVWIMPIHRVVASFRPAAEPPFDVIIVDEASQVGLLEVPILALCRRAIIVGDDQQTSPEHVGAERQPAFDLIDEHLGDIRDRRTRFDPDNSLYDIARQRFPQVVQLREHFRCLPRIIEFSNQRWYNGTIVPLRDRPPHPGWQPLATLHVPGGVRRRSDDTNAAEAEAVVELIAALSADKRYDDMTFGVITLLGTGQAPLITGRLLDRFGPTFVEDRRLRVGDPAGFQGDERDVIICSLVVAHDPDVRIGATNTAAAARRINVAASRARNQMWIVHSVHPDSLHADDPRRALLEYCLNPPDDTAAAAILDRAESDFERQVMARLLDAGYTRVVPQYAVGGYHIDIVVEGPETRLAIECDGDRWHGPDAWDRDRTRQVVLERAGWTFERIRGSAFYRDPHAALEPLWRRLDQLDIPKVDWTGTHTAPRLRWTWPDDLAHLPTTSPRPTATAVAAPLRADPPIPTGTDGLFAPPARAALALDGPTTSEVRDWARQQGLTVGERGRLSPDVIAAWNRAHPDRHYNR